MHALRWLGAVATVSGVIALTIAAPAGANPHAGQLPHVEHCHPWPGYTAIHWDRNELQARDGSGDVTSVGILWDGPFQGDFQIFRMDNENYATVTPIFALSVQSFSLHLANGRTDTFLTDTGCT